MRSWAGRFAICAGLLLAGALLAQPAAACGGFFRALASRKPSLAREEVLIVFDRTTRLEHFVRRVSFRAGREVFGFVVPTPSRPTVEAVAHDPFIALRRDFPFARPHTDGIGLGSGGLGRGAPGGAPGVSVLEQKRVGSFTAFVLAASDPGALAGWLRANGLASTPETDQWLAHYVALDFYYVAMRYEPPADAAASPAAPLRAETMRITFATPLAYYPYLEPAHEAGEVRPGPRLLELWVVSPDEVTPVALMERGGTREWVRPFAEGDDPDRGVDPAVDGRHAVRQTLGALGQLVTDEGFGQKQVGYPVQVFMDQKVDRQGFGDVVFIPRGAVAPSGADLIDARSMLRLLDPSLISSGAAPEAP